MTGTSVTLEDDETASTGVTLSVNPTSVGEADAATAVVVTAALDGVAASSATAVTVAVGDSADSATEGTDYATVVGLHGDDRGGRDERDGDVHLDADPGLTEARGTRRSRWEGTATGLTVTGTSVTLEDDETASTEVTLSVNPTSVGEADAAAAVVVTAALDGGGSRAAATAVTVAVGEGGRQCDGGDGLRHGCRTSR